MANTALLSLALALCLSAPGLAAEETSPWTHTAEASLLLTSGNTSVNTLGLGASTLYASEPWKAKAAGSYLQSSNSGTQVAELFTLDARGDRSLSSATAAFLQAGFLRNLFAGFNSRTSADAGINYAFLTGPEHLLSLEGGLGAITEDRLGTGANTFASARIAADYKWKLSPTADFGTNLAVLDNLMNVNDLRLTSVTSLTVAMTTMLSMKLSFRLDYLNVPVTGKKSLDTASTVALVAKF
jgi:putative salt-induced outer membrane protein